MIDAYYSDPHYGHLKIIEYCDRPFADVEEMQTEMIKRYNDRIGTSGIVLWTGDCFMGPESKVRAADVMSQLNGRKLLVRGNHDKAHQTMLAFGFELVCEEMFLRIAERRVRAIHFPPGHADPTHFDENGVDRYESKRPPKVQDEIIMHGHTHQTTKGQDNLIHVGVDAWDYAPAMHDDVVELIAAR
jgi:calcineurin-like phosphoesterase family protein